MNKTDGRRIAVHLTKDDDALFQRVREAVSKRVGDVMAETVIIRLAIKALARKERVS